MPNSSRYGKDAVENTIPNWVLYLLLASLSLLIAKSVHGSIAIITALGLTSLFALSYLSKPVAEIQPAKRDAISNKNKTERATWGNPSEPNAQRKRYLRSIDDADKAA